MKLKTNFNIIKLEMQGQIYNVFNVMVQLNIKEGLLFSYILN